MSWLTALFIDEDNAQLAAAADAKNQRINQRRAEELGDAWRAQVERDQATDAFLTTRETEHALSEAFDEGWADGRRNVSNTITGAFNRIIADPLRAVIGGLPWWLWFLGLLFVLWKLGALAWLWRQAKGKFA